MENKVTVSQQNETTDIENILQGQFFTYPHGEIVYIKSDLNRNDYVSLKTGCSYSVRNDTKVVPLTPYSKITINTFM